MHARKLSLQLADKYVKHGSLEPIDLLLNPVARPKKYIFEIYTIFGI